MDSTRIVIIVLYSITVLAACTYMDPHRVNASQPEKSTGTEIIVDAGTGMGDMPGIFRAGVFENLAEAGIPRSGRDYIQQKFFSDLLPGMTTIFVPLLDGNSFDDYKTRVEKGRLLEDAVSEAKRVLSGGGRVLFDLQMMPEWLSSKPHFRQGEYFRFPPKNYDTWKDLISYVVQYLHKRGLTDADYRIWEEVDTGLTAEKKFWHGTSEAFMKLYKYSVEAIRSIDSDAKVTFGLAGLDNDILPEMAKYAVQHRLPLNYIIWHPFRTPPYPHEFEYDVKNTGKILRQAGFHKDIGLHAESWNSWLEFGKPDFQNGWPDERSLERDTEYNASFVIQTVNALDAAGVSEQSFFTRVDFSFGKLLEVGAVTREQQFYGGWGMFTRSLVVKPVYNAFRVLSILNGKEERRTPDRLKVDYDETDYIAVIASRTKDRTKVRVLVTNYVPPQTMMTKEYVTRKRNKYLHKHYGEKMNPLTDCLSKGGHLKECSSSAPADLRSFLGCIAEEESEQCSALIPEHLRVFTKRISDRSRHQKQIANEVSLQIEDIPFSGKAMLTSYTIDSDSSNSCRYNKRTEDKPSAMPCGINGAVDRMVSQAKREAVRKSQEFLERHPKLRLLKKTVIEKLFIEGTYTSPDNDVVTIPLWLDKINNDLNISLEGSRQKKGITVSPDGKFKDTLHIEPNGVVLIEIRQEKR